MAVWLIAVFFVADNHASEALCKGMRIEVSDTSLRHFVTAREIARELGTLPQRSAGMRLADINTEEIGRRLAEIDKIESANVVKLADGRVLVTVIPLLPVARVFRRLRFILRQPRGETYPRKCALFLRRSRHHGPFPA